MKPSDLTDWFVLRRYLARPWAFVRLRHAPPATTHVDLPLRDGGSFRIRTGEHDRHVFKRIFARDEYGLDGLAPGRLDTVVDVGAHIGAFALRVAPLARRVICLEPDPANFELLRANTARLGHVTCVPRAVAAGRSTRDLHLGINGSRNSLRPADPGRSRGAIPVETAGLDDVFREHGVERCDLLKIDCEGGEYEIVYGAPPGLWSRIERIRMEYHPVPEAADRESGEGLARHFAGLGRRTDRRPHRKRAGEGLLYSDL